MEDKTKENLRVYGIFFGFIIFMTAILILFVSFARESWRKGLALDIQNVLNENNENSYIVDEYVAVDSLISTSSAVYTLLKVGASPSEKYYGIIMRVPSIIGPIPAVFVCSANDVNDLHFVGYSGDYGKTNDMIDFKISSGIMNYWKNMIPKITEKIKEK